jgi:hypothetical protein
MTNELIPVIDSAAPALVTATGARASYRFLEFFTAQIRNPHTRRDGDGLLKRFSADVALPDLLAALAACERRVDFSQTCGARSTDPRDLGDDTARLRCPRLRRVSQG